MIDQRIVEELRGIVGEKYVLTDPVDLYVYSFDASLLRAKPDVVVRPGSKEEVVEVVRLAYRERIPVVARGAGTNLVGSALPVKGGIVIDLTRLNRILEINPVDLYCRVEPGVVHAVLEEELGKHGLFWPPDPGSSDSCTIGGILSQCASGMRALKYGGAREWVLALEVVLPTGEVIRTGTPTLRWAVGYDLTRLFVGAEGTLGVITEAVLKVFPLPESMVRLTGFFERMEDACKFVGKVLQAGIVPDALEIMDRGIIKAINEWMKLGLPEVDAYVMVDYCGFEGEVGEASRKLEGLLAEAGAFGIRKATAKEEIEELYVVRREAATALPKVTGKSNLTHDFCVPISKLAEGFEAVYECASKWDIPVAILSHACVGIIHPIFSVDVFDEEDLERAEKCYEELAPKIMELGGAISGEHGVGLAHAKFMEEACGRKVLELMRGIKRVFDPENLMNPGKLKLE